MGAFVTWRTASSNHRCSWAASAVPAQPHERSLGALPLPLGPCGWPRARFLPRVFCGLDPGCRAMFFVVFHFRQLKMRGGRSFETLLALHGAECCNSAKRELEIIAKPLRLLHEALLSGRSFLAPCAQKLATTLCPCNILPFVLFAARRFLQSVTYFVGRAARAPSRRFAFAAIDFLICAGVEAGPW